MSFDLDLGDIKDICGSLTYNKAIDMYLRNKVRTIKINENSEDTFLATAIVQSAYDVNNYKINILINNKNLRIYPGCSCPAFHQSHMCKHIGAVLVKLHYDGVSENRLGLRKSEEEELLESYKTSYEKEVKGIERELLNLEVTLAVEEEYFGEKRKKFYLELKIGSKRLYVVKNIKELIECIYKSGGTIYFGKELEYNNSIYTFKERDKEILYILKEVYDLNLEIMNRIYINKSIFFSGKKAFLTEAQIRKVFNILDGDTINLVFEGEIYKNVVLSKANLPISFYMFMKDENLNIDMNGELPKAISEEVGLYYLNNTLYLLSEKEKENFNPLYKVFEKKQDNTISFKQKEISDVANFLVPKLNEMTPVVMKDEKVKEIIKEQPLTSKFYLDKKKNNVICNIKFMYGDEEDQKDEGFINNIVEETKVLSKVHKLGFKGENKKVYIDDEDDLVEFLTYGIEELSELGQVYYSDSFKEMRLITPKSFTGGITLNDVDLLEFSFNIEGLSKTEMKDTLNSIRERKKYHKLKNGSLIPLMGKEVGDIYSLIENFDIAHGALAKGAVVLPKYASLYIDDKINNGDLSFVSRNSRFKELLEAIKDVKSSEYVVPKAQQGILRSYQEVGFKWFKTLGDCGLGGILGDEMGLGKTLQAITYINSQLEEGNLKNKALIVCPTSLVYNWAAEFEKFSKETRIAAISGTKPERQKIIDQIENYDVLITSYALLRRDIDFYKDMNFDLCIIDEAQYIKNASSLNAVSVKEIKAKSKFAMTGTPIENSLTELWSIFDYIMPGYLKTHGKFVKDFESPIVKDKDERVLQELLKLIRPFILRRFKKDVVLELPPKIEHKIVVEMTKEQKKLYYSYVEEYKNQMKKEISEKGLNRSKIKILSLLTRLRQLCCDPGSFIENYTGDSGKYLALYDILEESLENNHKVLLFSQFTTILGTIRSNLKKRGMNVMYLDGSVPSRDRMGLVNEFNEGDAGVFLISLKAGGTGLNLTSADTVIHFDPWWNPAVEEQAVDRAHRIGQKNTVEVIKLIAKGTIEEKIYKIQENKKAIIEKVIDGEEHTDLTLSSMNEEEIEELFS